MVAQEVRKLRYFFDPMRHSGAKDPKRAGETTQTAAFWLIHRQFLVVFLDGWSKPDRRRIRTAPYLDSM